MSHLSDIGFGMEREEFMELVVRAAADGERFEAPGGAYICWSPGLGIELWPQSNADLKIVGVNPHFSGAGRMRVGLIKDVPNPNSPFDGGVYGWSDPQDEEPETGWYPFVADLPNFRIVRRRLPLLKIVEMQIAAFAHTLSCYPDKAAFAMDEPTLAPVSFVPTGLFDGQITELKAREDRHQALAMFTGTILTSDLLTNPETGHQFHHLCVETLGGTMDVVADPTIVAGAPIVGGTIKGSFWLSARILSELLPPPRPSMFRKRH